jgi:uncharacterized membrane protein
MILKERVWYAATQLHPNAEIAKVIFALIVILMFTNIFMCVQDVFVDILIRIKIKTYKDQNNKIKNNRNL